MPRLYRRSLFITLSIFVGVIGYLVTRSSRYEFYRRDVEAIQSNVADSPPPSAENTTDLCANPPQGHCEFYRDCLEAKYHCGPEGYPLGYGEKFCEKFQANQDELSAAGREWMLKTMQCLQRALVPEAQSAGSNTTTTSSEEEKLCDDLKEKAFASHAPCYIDNGLCTLGPANWEHIVQIIGVQTLIESWDAVKETLEAAEGCLDFYAFLLVKYL